MVGPGAAPLENANPLIYRRSGERPVTAREEDDELPDAIDDREIFDLIRSINDPEHPLTLEELNVVEEARVKWQWALWVPAAVPAGERCPEHGVGGVHAHHPPLQHGHPHRPLHQGQAAPLSARQVQAGCSYNTRNTCL
ncbi:cytosolic iron-sulfur assembly component 2B isoform X2 [Taeniopygia guttata]|uniref:cytosolic iron-sulfur assembly component 2B isoform X2 n=1 Tax=Taeniopygia guttata TaxID=59729 RepID=UPI0013F1A443